MHPRIIELNGVQITQLIQSDLLSVSDSIMDIDAKDIQNHGLSQKTNGHGD